MQHEQLKNCPFCGSKAHIYWDDSDDYKTHHEWYIGCEEWQKCGNATADARSKIKEKAIAAWNARPREEAQRVLLLETATAIQNVFNECGFIKNHASSPDAFFFQKGRIEVATHPLIAALIDALINLKSALSRIAITTEQPNDN